MLYWVTRPWKQIFNFRDRATRREYWLFLVQLYAAFTLVMILAGIVIAFTNPDLPESSPEVTGIVGISLLLLFIPYLSASVRRLHDHDKSGWMFLLTLVPLAGWIFYLIMMLTPGTPGENGYGPDPRDKLESPGNMADVFR